MAHLIYISLLLFVYVIYVAKTPRRIGDDYLTRYYVIPRNAWFNVYLHKFTADDDHRALHDHPWWSISLLLKGRLTEHLPKMQQREIEQFKPVYRPVGHPHRMTLQTRTAWTLFITGPVVRQWGFHCPKGWVHWEDYTDESGNRIGAGCGE